VLLRVGETGPLGVSRGGEGVETHRPLGHPPQRLVFRVKGFKGSAPLVVPPLVKPVGNRSLEAVNFGFQRGVPCNLPLPPQPVLQAYLILITGRNRWPWVVTRATCRVEADRALKPASEIF
jgi:hypothetical protein